MTTTTDYQKTITPAFEAIGKRRRLVGYLGELHNGETLLHSQEYPTTSQAEQALDRIVYDILSDLAERELLDDVPMALEANGVTSTQIPSWLRELTQAPIGQCSICDCAAWQADPNGNPLCPDHYGVLQEFADPPGENPLGDSEGDPTPPDRPRAVTLTSIAIESTLQRNRICANCQGPHITWQCPQIAIVLFAPPKCPHCGDPTDRDGETCRACRQWDRPAALIAA